MVTPAERGDGAGVGDEPPATGETVGAAVALELDVGEACGVAEAALVGALDGAALLPPPGPGVIPPGLAGVMGGTTLELPPPPPQAVRSAASAKTVRVAKRCMDA